VSVFTTDTETGDPTRLPAQVAWAMGTNIVKKNMWRKLFLYWAY
jgi:hypothetical protein